MTPFRDSRCPLDYGEKTSCLLAYPALEVWIPIAPKKRASLYMMLSEGVKANWDEEFQVPTKLMVNYRKIDNLFSLAC